MCFVIQLEQMVTVTPKGAWHKQHDICVFLALSRPVYERKA